MAPESNRDAKLVEAALALSSDLSLDSVLQRIVEVAADVTAARYAALGVLDDSRRISAFFTTGVSQEQRAAIGHIPVGLGLLGALIHDARPLRLRRITDDPRSVGFPPNHPPMASFLGAPVTTRGKVFGNIYLTEKQGAEAFDAEDERALVVLAAQAGVAIENARLYEEARLRERRLEAVREIGAAILEGRDPEEVLQLVGTRAMELARADLATVAVPRGDELVLEVAEGYRGDELRGRSFPVEGSLSGDVVREGSPVLVEDASADERGFQPIVQLGDMGPAMFVPLSGPSAGRAFGTLAVVNRLGGRRFDATDLALVETFANQAAVALEYGRAQRELKRLAVLDDRERIAKELHDGVIQSLFAVGMGLQAASALSGNEEQSRRIEGAVAEIDRAIRDLRNYIFGLRPGILADRHLDQALRDLAQDFEQKTGVVAAVDVDPDVASELAARATDVVQVAREALSNVGRHAEAMTVRLTLRRDDGTAVLEIDDDGRGFVEDDVTPREGGGQGLRNVRERVRDLGGDVTVESEPGAGTILRARLPLD